MLVINQLFTNYIRIYSDGYFEVVSDYNIISATITFTVNTCMYASIFVGNSDAPISTNSLSYSFDVNANNFKVTNPGIKAQVRIATIEITYEVK